MPTPHLHSQPSIALHLARIHVPTQGMQVGLESGLLLACRREEKWGGRTKCLVG
jgi:hypothetical protein